MLNEELPGLSLPKAHRPPPTVLATHAYREFFLRSKLLDGNASPTRFMPKALRCSCSSCIAGASAIRLICLQARECWGHRQWLPPAMTEADIKATIEEFAQSAKNAVAAGFDGIELHGANGYLLEQFIRPNSNQRTDRYGGLIENRSRLVLEVADAAINA